MPLAIPYSKHFSISGEEEVFDVVYELAHQWVVLSTYQGALWLSSFPGYRLDYARAIAITLSQGGLVDSFCT